MSVNMHGYDLFIDVKPENVMIFTISYYRSVNNIW